MDQLDIHRDVKVYSVVVGVLMLIIFVAPCILMAFLVKLFQKKATPAARKLVSTVKSQVSVRFNDEKSAVDQVESDSSWYMQSVMEVPPNKLEYIEQIATLKYGTNCVSTWKAYAPSTLIGAWPSSDSARNSGDLIIAVRKITMSDTVTRAKHANCLKMEYNAIAPLPTNQCILNLLGISKLSPTGPPYALLFEFPLYGSLHSFLTCKKQGIASDNSSKWAGLEFRSLEPSVLSALPECNRKVLSPHLANYISRAGPFMAPLNKPLASLDMLLFALQVADAMEFLEKSRVSHKQLSADKVQIASGFYLKLSGFTCGGIPLAHRNLTYSRVTMTDTRSSMKWRAPEVLLGEEPSWSSEVWTFGMIMWEICSLGSAPLEDLSLGPLPGRNLAEKFRKGLCPPQPETCSDDLYSLMKKCWRYNPENRPTLAEMIKLIHEELDKITVDSEGSKSPIHASNPIPSIHQPSDEF